MRHFHIINIPNASDEILTKIFDTILRNFLTAFSFNEKIIKFCTLAVASTIDMYNEVNKNLLPIPSKFHYLFNMRDISKVFQGILMARPYFVTDTAAFTKLWLHECQRIFMDRLCTPEDIEYF